MGMQNRIRLLFAAMALAMLLPVSSATGQITKLAQASDSTCQITGIVAGLRKVERSPWTDGTPSTMSVSETHILVSILNRRPHKRETAENSTCNETVKKNELARYKLCSSKRPKPGNRIRGTEGGSTGSSNTVRCLFDLEILKAPAPEAQPIKETAPLPQP